MIGSKINGRYQVLSELGNGGMAIVYKARDLILDRFVAVKVLRSEFSRNEEFIKRFHREAESVASLSHPNIVSIYDIGEEDDCYYIVMEYVKGTTLKSLINHYAPLPFEESIYILKQIMSAIEHAHQNGIVHRDIKPHNILIDEEDHVKVTDFGIAVAMTSATITFTNSIMGSAHYLSPEQARGGKATFKSDIYSLGIVMFEMLTGDIPFSGNSPVTVALKHLNEVMPRPKDVNPSIPQSLENITMKALAKDPQYRYDQVHEMYDDINTALLPERLEELPLEIPEENDNDVEKTKIISPIKPINEELSEAKGKKYGKGKKKKKSFKILWVLIIVFLMLIGAGIASFTLIPKLFYVPNVTVPNVVNQSYQKAESTLKSKNLKVSEQMVYDDTIPSGKVTRQSPFSGNVVKEKSKVTLFVSKGPPKQAVNEYVGYQKSTVQSMLQNIHYKNVKYIKLSSSSVPEGQIIKQSPKAGSNVVPEETTLVLTVSSGPEKVQVPDLTTKTKSDVQTILNNYGLIADFQQDYSDVVPKDQVIRQDPPPNQKIAKGSKITVWLSEGPKLKPVNYTIHIQVPYTDTNSNSSGTGSSNSGNGGTQKPTPEHVKITYTDSNHPNETTFIADDTITQDKEYQLPVTINPNDNASFKVYVNGTVIFGDTLTYNDITQTGAN